MVGKIFNVKEPAMKESGKGRSAESLAKRMRELEKELGIGEGVPDGKLCPQCREVLHEKIEELRHCYEICLEERKKVEKAKWVLVKKKALTEEDAHKFLVAAARRQRKKLAEIAESVIKGEKFLDEAENANLLNRIVSERKGGK